MRSFAKDNRGFALILTIMIVSLIVSVTLHFNGTMRSNLSSSANLRDAIRLGCIARSGFDYALAVLHEDIKKNDFDSVQEEWADAELIASNAKTMFEKGTLEVRIIDHSGKIQINNLVNKKGAFNVSYQNLLKRFLGLEQFGLDTEEVDNIIDALKDWLDADDEVTRFGAENSFYQALERPYNCKNGALESLEELLLVRGIGKELYYGSKEKPGIFDYMTVYGEGKININTAPPLLLMALSEQMDRDMVDHMVKYREDEENDLRDSHWYRKVSGMGDVTIPDDLISTVSIHFEIQSAGALDAMMQWIRGFVKRDLEGKFQILSWKID